MGGITIYRITGGQSPAVRTKSFVVLWIADAVSAVDKRKVTHFIEITWAVLVFQSYGIKPQEGVLRPEERSGFGSLIAQMKVDTLYFVRRYNGSVLCPSFVIYSGRNTVSG